MDAQNNTNEQSSFFDDSVDAELLLDFIDECEAMLAGNNEIGDDDE